MATPTATSIYTAAKAALTVAGVAAYDGPADDLPTGADGLVAQAAVMYPGRLGHDLRRMSGGRSGAEDAVTVHCVGATVLDALAVSDKVAAAFAGLKLSAKGGPMGQSSREGAVVEPNADPRRVSIAVEYTSVTKG